MFNLFTEIPQFWGSDSTKNAAEFFAHEPMNNKPTIPAVSQFLTNEIQTLEEQNTEISQRLVCYYTSPATLTNSNELFPLKIDPHLCTHINVGILSLENNRIVIPKFWDEIFKQFSSLKKANSNLKVLLWVGGPFDTENFLKMISTHRNRRAFIKSIISALKMYELNGVDLDWEFPIEYNKIQLHFAQLLEEIRMEYRHHMAKYLLSVAVAAPEGIAFFGYNIRILNENCDYVNIMTYDYHLYSKDAPFTGIFFNFCK